MVNPAEMGGRRPGGKASSFAVTCSLLSQYLKERGGLGLGYSAAAAANPAAGRGEQETLRTMNLLPNVDAAGGDGGAAPDERKGLAQSMDLFPQRVGFGPSADKKTDTCREPQKAQMTIFYGGKVMVFDDFPSDKAREMMVMAGRGCPTPAAFRNEEPAPPPPKHPSCPPPRQHKHTTVVLASNPEAKSIAPAPVIVAATPSPEAAAQDALEKPLQPASSDLPIARRVSLHRFLEKRKDRITAKAPYPVSSSPAGALGSSSAAPMAKPEESRQWLGLALHVPSKPEDFHGYVGSGPEPETSITAGSLSKSR